MYCVYQMYGNDDYGYAATVVAAFRSLEAAEEYAAERSGCYIQYHPVPDDYPEFTSE